MNIILRRICGAFIVYTLILKVSGDDTNETLTSDRRQSRVTGRIVKLYSGIRPGPVVCNGEGFQEDPNDCAVFYRCMKSGNGKYTVFRFQCGPGTVYDPETEVCNYPGSTKRIKCGGLVQNSESNVHANEIEGAQYEIPSPIGSSTVIESSTIYSTMTTKPWTTVKLQELETQASARPSTVVLPPKATTVQQKPINNVTPVTFPPSHLNPHTNDQVNICTTDGFMGDSQNCRKFYRCVGNQKGGYTKYEFSCSESTVWDDDSQSCNHAWAVKRSRCGRLNLRHEGNQSPIESTTLNKDVSYIPDVTESNDIFDKTIQEQLQISYGLKVTQTQTQIGIGIQNQTQINYGNRTITKSDKESRAKQNQTQISNGSATSQSQTQILYGDKGVQTQLQIDHSKNSSQTQTQVFETSSDNIVSTTAQSTNTHTNTVHSNNQCTQSGFIGDNNDCKKFYRCVDNGKEGYTKYEFSCGEGTVWDQNLEACNHAWAVKECGAQVPTTSSHIDTSTSKTTESYSTSTSVSIVNQNPSSESITTEDDNDVGYGNQNQEQTTVTQSQITTGKSTTTTKPVFNDCQVNGFIGDEKDCKIFYRCVENGKGGFTKYEFKCGEGTVWDSELGACNHAWAVKKCGGQISDSGHNIEGTTTKQTTTYLTTTSHIVTELVVTENDDYDTGYGSQTVISSTTTVATTKTPTDSNNFSGINCKSSGFMGDKNDCKKFYRCVDNGNGGFTKYEFTCGEGTVWDPKIESCNHAWAVENCGQTELTTAHQNVTTSSTEPTESYPTGNTESHVSTTETINQALSTTSESQTGYKGECTRSGFVGAKNDCKMFYRCVDNGDGSYTKYEFSCGEGTVWDQEIEACNHAWAVKTCGYTESSTSTTLESTSQITTLTSDTSDDDHQTEKTSTTTSGNNSNNVVADVCHEEGFMKDKIDCKKFYRCVDNGRGGYTQYEFSCGEGTFWNQEILSCDHASSSTPCKPIASDITTKYPAHNDEIDTETSETPVTSSTSTTEYVEEHSTSKIETVSSNKCTSDGFYGDQNDCKKFYRCVNDGKGGFTKYEFNCGEGTIWDNELQTCNHESTNKNNCTISLNPVSSTTTMSPIQVGDTSTTTEYYNSTQEPSINVPVANKCVSEGYFADPNDCKKFLRCVSNGKGGYTKYEFTCGEGTIWVQDLLACDHDTGDDTCDIQISIKPSTSTETQETTDKHESDYSTTQSSQSTETQGDEYYTESSSTSAECSKEGFYGNKYDCKKFYRCVDNGHGGYTKYDYTCSEGTAWDPEIQACNHDDQVASCQGSQVIMHDDNNNTLTTESSSTIKAESTTTSGGDSPMSTTGTTSTTKTNNAQVNGSTQDSCEQEGYFGNKQDCKKFYRCVDNGKGGYTKYDFDCGEGTIWDQDLTVCNHPQDVANPSCNQNQEGGSTSTTSSSSSSSSSGSSSSTTSSSMESSTQDSSHNCSQETSKKPDNKNVNCTKAGYYPDPDDCKKFYRCVDWDGDGKKFSVFHFECGEGTIWDPAIETCNHEDSVYPPRDCSSSQSQSESKPSSNESTTSSTTQQITTEKSTTQKQTTTESTTTQQESSPPTTTQKSTTAEQTTTKQSTTTTHQSTSTEQTTTHQSSTTEQTTTQQSSTSEHTTTEPTTTQQTINSEQTTESQTTTTEPSTTSEQTTQQSSSSEHTTNESTTTTEQTTDQSTDETTTQHSTTEQSSTENAHEGTTTTEQSNESSTTEQQTDQNSSEKECPETEDDQHLFVCSTSSFRRHPKYCNLFYQCDDNEETHEINISVFSCPNNTIYDESQTKCVSEDKANKKCDGEISQRRRVKRLNRNYKEPIVASKDSYACSSAGYFPFEKESECSPGFLKCEKNKSNKLRGLVHQCPAGYVYWSISKRCEPLSKMKGCKQSKNDWAERWQIPVERRNVAYM